MNIKELYWAAGFIEGEASIGAYSVNDGKGWHPKITVAQNQLEPLQRLKEIFGGKIYLNSHPATKNGQCSVWTSQGKAGIAIMMTIWSLISSRRKAQIELAIARWKTNNPCRGKPGATNHAAKLSVAQALEIFHSKEPNGVLRRRFGVSKPTVCKIRSGENWASVTGGRSITGYTGT